MAEVADDNDDTLVLVFGTDRPISASDIGMLLRDLSGDYTRATGGRLILWRYETGSSWIYLRDAIAVAGSMAGSITNVFIAVEHMAKFVGLLKSQFGQTMEPAENSAIEHVSRSAARIAKIAAENNADVNVRYTKNAKTGIEDFSLSIDHHHAKKLHASYSRKRTPKKDAQRALTTKIDATGFREIAQKLIANDGLSDDVVDTMVAALKSSGGDYLLPSLASSLEAAGRYDMAQIVRRHITGPDSTTVQLTRD